MDNDPGAGGRLVTEDGDPWPAGATVEVWEPGRPGAAVPADVPVASLDDGSLDGESIGEHLLGTARTDEHGRFDPDVSARSDGVSVRVFDEDGELLDTADLDAFDPEAPLLLAVERSSGGVGWKELAVGAVATGAVSVYVLGSDDPGSSGQRPGDPTEQDHAPRIDSPDRSGPDVRRPADQGRFLYTGDDPVQTGVEEGAIDDAAATILRGRTTTPDGEPLGGVTVGIQGHPEFGRTETRDTGLFDMVVNGGRQYVVSAEKEDRLPVQRKREIPRSDHVWVDDLALVTADDRSTTVENGASVGQVHRASGISDDDGERRTRIYFPPGTSAATGNDGAGIPTELEVRATEYTVGDRGPNAMPGELPPVTGYTYAVELTAEATGSAGSGGGSTDGFGGGSSGGSGGSTGSGDGSSDGDGASGSDNGLARPLLADAMGDVQFDRPVVVHLDNFLEFPVGGLAPTGVLGRDNAAWEPMDNGRVIEVLGSEGGLATLDVTGSGQPSSRTELARLDITNDEREHIAAEFSSGDTIWRSRLEHFTPCDLNWPTESENDERPGDGGANGRGGC